MYKLLVTFLLLTLGACAPVDSESGSTLEVPDFTISTIGGEKFTLSETLKTKDAVLVFWTTWCPACVREIPDVEEYYRKNGDKVAVIGINIQESESKVRSFVENKDMTYMIGLDSNGTVARLFKVSAIPTIIAISRDGKILYRGHDISEVDYAGKKNIY